MTIEEAIKHIDEVVSNGAMCERCCEEHLQLKQWLLENIELKMQVAMFQKRQEIKEMTKEECEIETSKAIMEMRSRIAELEEEKEELEKEKAELEEENAELKKLNASFANKI